ncbi:MAG: hypothetical protein IPJ88_01285 [Myxococcales bacterium]|nr:MAG: hypothetical protein IPJ88_01285 [Myxococcales bacterium]
MGTGSYLGFDDGASMGDGSYYLIPLNQTDVGLEFIGPGNYEDSVDKLAGSYKPYIEQRFSDHVLANGGLDSCGDRYGEPLYRAYEEDGKQVANIVQYYKRGKLIFDRSTQQVYRVMLGRRFFDSNAFASDTQIGGCTAFKAAQAFSYYALFNGSAKGLGNPVSEPFCLPDVAGAPVGNPNAELPRIPVQYFDYGRLEFRGGQVELADLGITAFLQDESNKDPSFGFMDSGFIKVSGELQISLATPVLGYLAVNPAPTPEKIPLLGVLIIAGLVVLGGAIWLLVRQPANSLSLENTYVSAEWQVLVQQYEVAIAESALNLTEAEEELVGVYRGNVHDVITRITNLLARLEECANDIDCISAVKAELMEAIAALVKIFADMSKAFDSEHIPWAVKEVFITIANEICKMLASLTLFIRRLNDNQPDLLDICRRMT